MVELIRFLAVAAVLVAPVLLIAGEPNVLPAVPVPKGNRLTNEKIALGKQLYFEPRLSSNNTISCATCHDPAKGYSNGESFAAGAEGKLGGRNTPTVINTAYQDFQFWDGRAKTLEDQALGPIANPVEMNLPISEAVARLNAIDGYRDQFVAVFGTEATPETLAQAIASYERTIVSKDSPYDRYKSGDTQALSPGAVRGMALFFGKANCSSCHSGPNFTDNAFHNIGYFAGNTFDEAADIGRAEVSKVEGDRYSFKTPTLREISRTAPYMHDGGLKTLREVLEHYNTGGTPNPYLDEDMAPLKLTSEQLDDLLIFLVEGLAGFDYPEHTAPELP